MKIVRLGMMSLIVMFWVLGLGRAPAFAAYVSNPDGTVSDTKTGLVWQQTDDGVKRTWDSAVQYCENLTYAGQSDWRLPRIDELRTIVNYLRYKPAMDPAFSAHTDPLYSFTWSSTVYVSNQAGAYYMDFYDGKVDYDAKSETYFVRCVRGGPFWPLDPSGHLQLINTNTVWDNYSGYAWQRSDDGILRTWENAKSYCEQLELDGSTDWRLPTIDELQTIIDYTMFKPALSTEVFTGSPNWYWSSSSYVGSIDIPAAWIVDFSNGYLDAPYLVFYNVTTSCRVRCVRTAPAAPGTLTVGKAGTGTGKVTSIPAGIDCGSTCSASFAAGSQVRLTALGDAGSELAEWSGGGCSETDDCVVAIQSGATVNVTASFDHRYVDNGGGTVLDTKTGLLWQQADDSGQLSWSEAGQYCENLVLGAYNDWRLPKLEALQSIVDSSRSNPAINPIFECLTNLFWSKSAKLDDPLSAWGVDFSDGDSFSNSKSGKFSARCVKGFYNLSGICSYYSNSQTVSGVTLSLTGGQSLTQTSGADGSYTFTDLLTGGYSLAPSKSDTAGADKAITSLDASLVLQAVVHLITLTPQQTIAADVDSSGDVNAQDASYILQKVVHLVELPFPGSSRIWAFAPSQRSYSPLSSDQTGQNFSAILLGDVNGNWTPSLAGTTGLAQFNEAGSSKAQRSLLQTVPWLKGTARLSVGKSVRDREGNFRTPIQMKVLNGQVFSGAMVFEYAAEDFDAVSVSPGPLAKDAMVSANLKNPGEVRIALASPTAISESGELLSVVLKPKVRKTKPPVCFLSDINLNAGKIKLVH